MIFVNQLPDAYLPAPKNTLFFGGLNLKYNFYSKGSVITAFFNSIC